MPANSRNDWTVPKLAASQVSLQQSPAIMQAFTPIKT